MLTADQLLARLYALRKDYADDPTDLTYQVLHHAFMFVSYNMAGFKDYVKQEAAKGNAEAVRDAAVDNDSDPPRDVN